MIHGTNYLIHDNATEDIKERFNNIHMNRRKLHIREFLEEGLSQ